MKFSNYLDAQYHFSSHLDYAPIVCLVCSARYQSLDQVMKHFQDDHDGKPTDNFLYYINHEPHVEKWIENYLKYQSNHEVYKLFSPDNALFCPVCSQLTTHSKEVNPATISMPIQAVFQHLNTHLNYRPFWCNICYKSGLTREFSYIGEEARNHVKSHGYAPSDNFLNIFFIKTCIPRLESFINNYVLFEWYPVAIMQNTSTNSQNIPFRSSQLTLPRAELTNTSIEPLRNGVSEDHLLGPTSVMVRQPLLTINSANSSSPVTTGKNPKPVAYTTNMSFTSTRLNNFNHPVFCFHCKMLFGDINTLKTHHQQFHTNLTLACYPLLQQPH